MRLLTCGPTCCVFLVRCRQCLLLKRRGRSWCKVEAGEGLGHREGEVVVGKLRVFFFGHARRGDSRAEEAGVVAGELGFDGGEVHKVWDNQLVELWVLLSGGASADGEDLVDIGVDEALAQDALAYHAGCAEEDRFQGLTPEAILRDAI